MTTSRERVHAALNHQDPDRVPVDLGASPVSGIQVNAVYGLRQAMKLDAPGTPVKVIEPYQMLGEVAPDLQERLCIDTVPLWAPKNLFGFENVNWKEWTTFQGTPVLVPEAFNTQPEPDGSLLLYPEGDRSVPPSGRMPKDGYYFDAIVRQPVFTEDSLDPNDNIEDFGEVTKAELDYYRRESERLYTETDKAIFANFGGTGFGDIALVPAPWMKHPKGLRDIQEWYMSIITRPDYIRRVFEGQCEIALRNLAKIHEAVGERVSVLLVSGTDFGTQRGPFLATETYCDLFKPFHKIINDWIHKNTTWKCFIHSCGGVRPLIPHFIEAGFDVLNPVQCSAAGMTAAELKAQFGSQIVFWGGGVDTQYTLPFDTAVAVRVQVKERLRVFARGGGYVFNTIHNIQSGTPVENILAMYETVAKYPEGLM